jgi:phosphatidylglycerophosphate synthase
MDHTRENRSFLAEPEKRLLTAIARRMPAAINSDHLTLLGLVSMPIAGAAFALIPRTPWAAATFVLALAANWFGDSLDGTLARVRNRQRPRYGYYVDHVVDLVGTASLIAGIAASGAMRPWLAVLLFSAYVLVAAESFLATHALGVFRISFGGFGPTELRIVLALGAIAIADSPWVDVVSTRMLLFDLGGVAAIAGLVSVFVVSALRNTRALYFAEMR